MRRAVKLGKKDTDQIKFLTGRLSTQYSLGCCFFRTEIEVVPQAVALKRLGETRDYKNRYHTLQEEKLRCILGYFNPLYMSDLLTLEMTNIQYLGALR